MTEKYERDRREYAQKVEKYTSAAIAAIKYDVTSITIPSAEQGAFLELLGMKMTPLWATRGTERVENGTAISLRDGEWMLRVGELKQETRKGGGAVGATRGVICEVTWMEVEGKKGEAVGIEDEDMMRAFLERLLDGTGVKVDAARTVVGYTSSEGPTQTLNVKQTNWALAELYTELLRSRG